LLLLIHFQLLNDRLLLLILFLCLPRRRNSASAGSFHYPDTLRNIQALSFQAGLREQVIFQEAGALTASPCPGSI